MSEVEARRLLRDWQHLDMGLSDVEPNGARRRRDAYLIATPAPAVDRLGKPCIGVDCIGYFQDVSPPEGERLVRCSACRLLLPRFAAPAADDEAAALADLIRRAVGHFERDATCDCSLKRGFGGVETWLTAAELALNDYRAAHPKAGADSLTEQWLNEDSIRESDRQ